MKSKLIILFIALALLFTPASNVYAQSPDEGDVIRIGENYTLASGEVINGSLIIIGGNVTIEKGAEVYGDIVVIGGKATIDGDASKSVVVIGGDVSSSAKTKGDMVVIGGQITLQKTAIVKGDVVTFGGQLTQEEGAEIGGNIVNNSTPMDAPTVPDVPNVPDAPNPPNVPNFGFNFNPAWEIMQVIGRALGIAALAMLLSLFLQPQLTRITTAITNQPFMAGGYGLLTVILTPIALLIMVVTLILIPVAILAAFIIPLAWLFGMIALGQEVGERFTKAINQIWPPVLTIGFGSFALVLIVGFIGMIPCIGWLLSSLVSLVAIGGVAMTLFGTRTAPGRPSGMQVIEAAPSA